MSPYQIPQSALNFFMPLSNWRLGGMCMCNFFEAHHHSSQRGQHRKVPSSLGSHDNFYIQYLYKKCGELSLCCLLLPHALSTSTIKQKVNSSSINFFFHKKNYTSSSHPNVRTVWPVAMLEFLYICFKSISKLRFFAHFSKQQKVNDDTWSIYFSFHHNKQ